MIPSRWWLSSRSTTGDAAQVALAELDDDLVESLIG